MTSYKSKNAAIQMRAKRLQEKKYDEEDADGTPKKVVTWVDAVLDGDTQPCPGDAWRKIQFHFRDGVVLCKLINKLLTAAGKTPIPCNTSASHTAFVAMENIDNFNKGAAQYGVPDECLFNSIDLYEGHKGPLLNVINCLNKLGFTANKQGFTPNYQAIEPPPRDAALWADK